MRWDVMEWDEAKSDYVGTLLDLIEDLVIPTQNLSFYLTENLSRVLLGFQLSKVRQMTKVQLCFCRQMKRPEESIG